MRTLLLLAAAGVLALPQTVPALAQAGAPDSPVGGALHDELRPGDVVRLRIWREPDLSGDFPVDAQGVVVFPKLGPVQVTGQSTDVLEGRLTTAYGEFLQHASIDVIVLRRLQVLGAVRNPGLYPVDETMTIGDVLALAGGTTTQGRQRRVELLRDGHRVTADLSGATRLAELTLRSGDQLFVPERSWLSRNTGVVTAAVSAGLGLVVSLITR